TMDTTIDQQVAMDEALVPTAQRLRIGRSNFRLLSDIKSKESTLQLVYDPLSIIMLSDSRWIKKEYYELGIVQGHATHLSEGSCRHKNQKKSNEMYYPRFTKAIIHHFMSKDPSIPRRNKFGALLPIELTNDEIKNSKAYKEYYAIATGEAAPKPKASVRRTRSSSDTSITPPTAAASPRLTASAKGKQTAKASKAKSLSAISEVAITEAQQLKLVTKRSMQQTHISQPSSSGADEGTGNDNEEKDDDGDEEDEGDDDKPRVTLVYSGKSKAAKKKVPFSNLKINKSLVVQIVLWYLDSRCSKHMTEDRSQLINFVQKFLGTVKFGNDQVAKIMGCDLEVAFRQHTCFIRNLDGVHLLTGSRGNNLIHCHYKI
nr:integrase, catalytic region, zinc finger, CCHC-type, peptidase aspartic, catalytic [Tanacetum cinerariifolium]